MHSDKSNFVAWIALTRTQTQVLTNIESALSNADLPSLTWYDILLELEKSGDQGLRAFRLQENLLLPQYSISRLLDRIEKSGYMERRPSDLDGRGHALFITDLGKEIRQKMWQVYRPALHEIFDKKLSDDEVDTLVILLDKLRD